MTGWRYSVYCSTFTRGGVSRSSVFLLSYLISNGIIQLDKERNVFN